MLRTYFVILVYIIQALRRGMEREREMGEKEKYTLIHTRNTPALKYSIHIQILILNFRSWLNVRFIFFVYVLLFLYGFNGVSIMLDIVCSHNFCTQLFLSYTHTPASFMLTYLFTGGKTLDMHRKCFERTLKKLVRARVK